MDIKRLEGETDFELIKRLVNDKLINKTIDIPYEDLSELLFGEGNCFNESEVRKRMYGMKRLFEVMEQEPNHVATRILSISDLHIPFQKTIETFKDYVGKVDILQINGDVVDNFSLSRFPKIYRISVMEELIQGRKYLIDLINYIHPKRVVVTYGNHCARFGKYLAKNLDSDILELMPHTSLDLIFDDGFNHYDKLNKTKTWYEPLVNVFDDIEIEYTGDWKCQIGETVFCHPQAFSSGIMKTAEKAMNWFRNEGYLFTSLIMSHTHRIGEYTIGNTTIYEQGCCCDTKKLEYGDGKLTNSQKEGYIYICQDSNGKIIKDKTQLVVLN